MAKSTSINKSKLFKRAWFIFKNEPWFPTYEGRARFGRCLEMAWQESHSEKARAFYAKQSIALASQTPTERLELKIAMLPYKSTRYDIGAERHRLEAELERLAA